MKDHIKNNAGYLIVVTLFSILFGSYRFSSNMVQLFEDFTYEKFINFGVDKPFVLRTLIGAVLHVVHSIIPISPTALCWLAECGACFMMTVLFCYYLNIFLKDVLLARIFSFTPFLILPYMMLFPRYLPFWYPYDLWSVVFNIAGLILIYQKKWLYFYLTFVLATVNRETSCFLTMTFLLVYFKQMENRKLFFHFAAQLFLWLAVKLAVGHIFANSPGPVFITQIRNNFNFLTNPYFGSLAHNENVAGSVIFEVVFKIAYLVGNFGFVWILVVFHHKYLKNQFLSRAALVLIPFTGAMLIVANIYEYRIFGEMLPFILAPAIVIIANMFRERYVEQPA